MNLIICATPFHVLLAEKIIEKYPHEEFYTIFLTPYRNRKFELYYNRIREKSSHTKYVQLKAPINKIEVLIGLNRLNKEIKEIKNINFNTIFLACIENIYTHALVSRVSFEKIITFDDGTANIDTQSFLYREEKKSILNKLFRTIFRIKYDMNKLKKSSKKHYTIYSSKKNISTKLEKINLFQKDKKSTNISDINYSIFLTQPIFTDNRRNIELYYRLYNKYHFDFYFPHPRDNSEYHEGNKIETELIFEDYLIQEISRNPTTHYTIYTCFSGAILNISHLYNVSVIALKPDLEEFIQYQGIYNFFDKNGILIEEV